MELYGKSQKEAIMLCASTAVFWGTRHVLKL